MRRSVWNTGCDSWYLDANGRNTTVWPGTTSEFRSVTKEVRLEEYEVRRAPAAGFAGPVQDDGAGCGGTRQGHVRLPRGGGGLMARLTASMSRPAGPYDLPAAARELTATSADGARLHVEVHGREQDPAVVLIHGWTCRTGFWAPVVRELTQTGHRVVAYDQRGHGRSPGADPRAYGPEVLADDLCAVLDAALRPGERAVLGGHSMGAMTLVAAAGTSSTGASGQRR